MAKNRFPGRALKLSSTRKKIKFNYYNEILKPTAEETYIQNIKKGLKLFRQSFGESDADENDFLGFQVYESELAAIKVEQTKRAMGYEKSSQDIYNNESNLQAHIKESEDSSIRLSKVTRLRNKRSINLVDLSSINSLHEANSDEITCENRQPQQAEPIPHSKTASINNENSLSKSVIAKKAKKLLAKAKKKCSTSEHSKSKLPKKFILPTKSVRSSRVIKPNKRLFDDITSMCSTTKQFTEQETKRRGAPHVKANFEQLCLSVEDSSDSENEKDPVSQSIALYTNAITEEGKVVTRGRSSKHISTIKTDTSPTHESPDKETKVKEKIEKLLRSPWDDRIKLNKKAEKMDSELSSSTVVLRKSRLNLNKKTLQKIRNPSSIQQYFPTQENGTEECLREMMCHLCHNCDQSAVQKYGLSCDNSNNFISKLLDETDIKLECKGGVGECQLVGLSLEERCNACWLANILLSSVIPNLMYDRLRQLLPSTVISRVPTSFGRSAKVTGSSKNGNITEPPPKELKKVSLGGILNTFGSVIDLPGGWKRLMGTEIVVLSPSGEKFKSVKALEIYLKNQGINADASIIFGNSVNKVKKSSLNCKSAAKPSNVVVKSLPGGWTRHIQWRKEGQRMDTFVSSPDGRTFHSRIELSTYFQSIGKVDDIFKYFPVVSKESSGISQSCTDASETSEMEPISSYENLSDGEFSTNTDNNLEALKCRVSELESEIKSSEENISKLDSRLENHNGAINLDLFSTNSELLVDNEYDSLKEILRHKKKKKKHKHKKDKRKKDLKLSDDCDVEKENTNVLSTFKVPDLSGSKAKKEDTSYISLSSLIKDQGSVIENENSDTDISSIIKEVMSEPMEVNDSRKLFNKKLPVPDKISKIKSKQPRKEKTSVVAQKSKVSKLSMLSTEQFGNNWSRRIKWDADGNGKVISLKNPCGQKIVSGIELQAYFKKAGKPSFDMKFYFPTKLNVL